MIKVGIIGGTGYTGAELLRLLVTHPEVTLQVITSRSEARRTVAELYPNLRNYADLVFSAPDMIKLAGCDVVFSATPNGIAMTHARDLVEAGVKLIDLAADFRIKDINVWQQWYGMEHACPELVAEAVYGLPESNRDQIKQARIIANPGCYPTAIQLALLPLLEQDVIDPASIIADAKSGVSGAGRGAKVETLYAEVADNFKAYGVGGHRHHPEIVQCLAAATGKEIGLTFVPHLTPMIRGMHATVYARTDKQGLDIQSLYEARYEHEPFVDVMPAGSHPETRSVRGNNTCRLAVYRPGDGDQIVVLSVIDNLVKGASGQAVQNMNIMFGFDEQTGLQNPALLP